MAEAKAPESTKPRKPTERAVLAEIAIPREVLREALPNDAVRTLVPGDATEDPVIVYVELGTATGSKASAVDEIVGKADGTYRAPSTSSWKGAIDQGEETIPESKKFRRRRVD